MQIINHTASTINLAKSWRASIDRSRAEATIPTETLLLFIGTLIELGEDKNGMGVKAADIQAKTVVGRTAALQSAIKDRDT